LTCSIVEKPAHDKLYDSVEDGTLSIEVSESLSTIDLTTQSDASLLSRSPTDASFQEKSFTVVIVLTKMKFSAGSLMMVVAAATLGSTNAYSFIQPMRSVSPAIRNSGTSNLKMISTGDDRSERKSLDISKTTYAALVKAPKDAYIAVSNCFRVRIDMSDAKSKQIE
jgi:hypothetical protein